MRLCRLTWVLALLFGLSGVATPDAHAQRRTGRSLRAKAKTPKQRRRAKPRIVGTLGPKTGEVSVLQNMIKAGMVMARINMSHNDARSTRAMTKKLSLAAKREGRKIPLLFDLPGGKARLTKLDGAQFSVSKGGRFDLVATPGTKTNRKQAGVSYRELGKRVRVGDRVLLDDDKIVLRVTAIRGGRISTIVERGGAIRGRMGLTVKDKELPFPAMTAQDRRKLEIAVDNGATVIGVSFVQSAKNVKAVRRALDRMGAEHVEIMAKIESYSGIDNLGEIMDHADSVMIARGDLSAAVGKKQLPAIQARISRMARERGKSFAVATGLMSNMLSKAKPSAANRADVRRTVSQQPSWLILNETAIGAYPVETVRQLRGGVRAATR